MLAEATSIRLEEGESAWRRSAIARLTRPNALSRTGPSASPSPRPTSPSRQATLWRRGRQASKAESDGYRDPCSKGNRDMPVPSETAGITAFQEPAAMAWSVGFIPAAAAQIRICPALVSGVGTSATGGVPPQS